MKKFRTIVFDLGGVLIDYSLERSIEAFRRIGYGQIETLIDPYRQSGVLLQLEKGEVGPEALYDEISRSVGRPVDPKAIDAALCLSLIHISEQGLTIDAYFDRLFLSYEMGLVKPGAEIFRQMIESSGIVPSQTLFIDDSQANVDTGKACGFDTYLAARNEDFRPLFDRIEPSV